MSHGFYIGQRLSFDGQLCTVRYHGEVKDTKGEWLGVEWDDPTRGKHAGEHAGTQYFQCTPILKMNIVSQDTNIHRPQFKSHCCFFCPAKPEI